MVDKSIWFFFLLFHPFIHSSFIVFMIFFSCGLQKELFFQIVVCRFLLCEIASFCLFFDEGDCNDSILFIDVLQIFSFEGYIFEIFHCLFVVNDVRWGWNWGCSYEMLVYGKIKPVLDNFVLSFLQFFLSFLEIDVWISDG